MKTSCFIVVCLALSAIAEAKQATVKFDFGHGNAGKERIFNVPMPDGRFLYLNHIKQKLDSKGRTTLKVDLDAPGIIYGAGLEIYIEPGAELSVNIEPAPGFAGSLAEENKFLNSLERKGVPMALKKDLRPVAMNRLSQLSSPDSLLAMYRTFISDDLRSLESFKTSNAFIGFVTTDIKLFYLDVAFSSVADRLINYLNAPVQYDSSQVHSPWGEALAVIAGQMPTVIESPAAMRSRHAFSCLYDLILRYRVAFLKENNAVADKMSMEVFQYNLFYAAPKALETHFNGTREFFIPNYLSYYITGTAALYNPRMIELFSEFSSEFPSSIYLPPLKLKIAEVKKVVDVSDVEQNADVHIIEEFEEISNYENMISSFKGKVVYIDIWAMWCSPCIAEFEFYQPLMKLAEKERDFTILFLSRDKISVRNKWEGFINKRKLEGYHMIPGDELERDLRNRIGWQAIPRYVIVDKEGKIVDADATPPRDTKTIDRIKELLATQ